MVVRETVEIETNVVGNAEAKTKKLQQNTNQLTKASWKLTGSFLGIMFAGMALYRAFGGLLQTQMELWGISELLGGMWTTVLAPIMEKILNFIMPIVEWFMNLSEGWQTLIGAGIILGAVIGLILMIFGQIALGLGALAMLFGVTMGFIGLIILIVIGVIAAIGLIVYGVVAIIQGEFKKGIAIILLVGSILFLFIGWWALLIVAVAIAVGFILRNWTEIKTFLGNTFMAIGGFLKTWLIDKPMEWIQGFFDWVKGIYDKIAGFVKKIFSGGDKVAGSSGGSLGSYQNGGIIPQTGNYTLHKGETVVPAGNASGIVINSNYSINVSDKVQMERMIDDNNRKLVSDVRRLVEP